MSEAPWKLALAGVREDFRHLQLTLEVPIHALLVEHRIPPLQGIDTMAFPPYGFGTRVAGPPRLIFIPPGSEVSKSASSQEVKLVRRGWIFSKKSSDAFDLIADRAWGAYCSIPRQVLRLVPEAEQARYVHPRPGGAVYEKRNFFGFPTPGNNGLENLGLWIHALFEIAFRRIPSLPISAEKLIWYGAQALSLKDLEPTRLLSERRPDLRWTTEWLPPNGPYHWFATIRDVVHASVCLCDYLLSLAPLTGDLAKKKETKQRKRGRTVSSDPEKDRKLVEDWQAANRQGATRKEFCRDRGIKLSELMHAQDRARKRKQLDAE